MRMLNKQLYLFLQSQNLAGPTGGAVCTSKLKAKLVQRMLNDVTTHATAQLFFLSATTNIRRRRCRSRRRRISRRRTSSKSACADTRINRREIYASDSRARNAPVIVPTKHYRKRLLIEAWREMSILRGRSTAQKGPGSYLNSVRRRYRPV